MPRTQVFPLLLATTIGCYSPSYVDCAVRCAGEDCPGGYDCDPQLHVCRPHGITGPCGATNDDANVANDGRLDSQIDAAPPTMCSALPTALFCADFDSTTLEQGWTGTTLTGTSMLSLVPSTLSLPNALASTTPTSNGTDETARLTHNNLAVPASFVSARVEFDFKVVRRDAAQQPKGFAFLLAGPVSIDMNSNGVDQVYYVINNNGPTTVSFPFATWVHIAVTLDHVGAGVNVAITHDGQLVNPAGFGQFPYPSQDVTWRLEVGAANTSTNGVCELDYDNVVVTLNQ